MMAEEEDTVMSRGDNPEQPLCGDILDVFPRLREKAVVDVVNGLEVVEDHLRWRDESPNSFLERLWDDLTGASARRQQAVDAGVRGVLRGMNEWLQGLQAAQTKSDIALARVAERLLETRQGVMKLQRRHRELKDEVVALERQLEDHIASTKGRLSNLQQALVVESTRSRAGDAVLLVKERWRTRRYEAVPPLLRVLLAANDLYWGDFGAFLRLKGSDDEDACQLVRDARDVLANMASDFAAAAGEEQEC